MSAAVAYLETRSEARLVLDELRASPAQSLAALGDLWQPVQQFHEYLAFTWLGGSSQRKPLYRFEDWSLFRRYKQDCRTTNFAEAYHKAVNGELHNQAHPPLWKFLALVRRHLAMSHYNLAQGAPQKKASKAKTVQRLKSITEIMAAYEAQHIDAGGASSQIATVLSD